MSTPDDFADQYHMCFFKSGKWNWICSESSDFCFCFAHFRFQNLPYLVQFCKFTCTRRTEHVLYELNIKHRHEINNYEMTTLGPILNVGIFRKCGS